MTYKKHLIDFNDFSVDEWRRIVELAVKIEQYPEKYYGLMNGKILATLFYEPSTRTQMSFQTAMLRLGGQIIGFDNPQTSSVVKGENLKDTIKVSSNYADIIVIRHPSEGAAKAAAVHSSCSVINAGDGGHLHPTQTLTDIVTLLKEKGSLSGHTIGVCGDLKYGRTAHSLVKALAKYENNRFVFISSADLSLPEYIKEAVVSSNSTYRECLSLTEAISELDVLYMTRVQRERFLCVEEYERNKDLYILNLEKLKDAKRDLKIMHPLPRTNEIDIAVDEWPGAIYFKQAKYGLYGRMALILEILSGRINSKEEGTRLFNGKSIKGKKCENKNCITNIETYMNNSFFSLENGNGCFCEFCDSRQLL